MEEEVKFVQKVASVVRSTRADYNLPNKTKTELYLQVFCETSAQVLISSLILHLKVARSSSTKWINKYKYISLIY